MPANFDTQQDCQILCFHVDHWFVIHLSVFLFPDDNLSKCQWFFTKLGMCIDIVEVWFGIANGPI